MSGDGYIYGADQNDSPQKMREKYFSHEHQDNLQEARNIVPSQRADSRNVAAMKNMSTVLVGVDKQAAQSGLWLTEKANAVDAVLYSETYDANPLILHVQGVTYRQHHFVVCNAVDAKCYKETALYTPGSSDEYKRADEREVAKIQSDKVIFFENQRGRILQDMIAENIVKQHLSEAEIAGVMRAYHQRYGETLHVNPTTGHYISPRSESAPQNETHLPYHPHHTINLTSTPM